MKGWYNCRQRWCETPHNPLDDHPGECGCELCHETHDWRDWNIYPECNYCEQDMLDEIWPLIEEAERKVA